MKAKLKTHGGYLTTNGQVFKMCGYNLFRDSCSTLSSIIHLV